MSDSTTNRRQFLQATSGLILSGALAGAQAQEAQGKTLAKTKLLVLGGTRFVGPALVEAALARGMVVTLFNRGKTEPQLFPQVEKLHGDRNGDLKALEGRRFDAVVDTSGYLPKQVKASAEALRSSGQYIFISSVSAYADSSKPANEDSPVARLKDPSAVDKVTDATYGALKALCEEEAERAMPGRVTVVRPGFIVGPRDGSDRFTYWPVRVKRGGEMLVPGAPSDPLQIIDVRDLADWLVKLIAQKAMGRFNAVGPKQPLTMGEMLRVCKEVTGANTTFTYVDAKFLEEQKVADGDFPLWAPPGSEFGGLHLVSNARAIQRGLTYRPLADTVRQTLSYWEGLPPERQGKPRTGMSAEREAQLLAAWKKRKV